MQYRLATCDNSIRIMTLTLNIFIEFVLIFFNVFKYTHITLEITSIIY